MQYRTAVVGFASGAAVAMALAWATAGVSARQPGSAAIAVCVSSDGIIRLAAAAGCAPPQKTVLLEEAGPDSIDVADAPAADPTSTEARRIAALERRLAALERPAVAGTIGNKVVAPFEVVDAGGQRVFTVQPGDVRVYSPGRPMAVRLSATEEGGFVTTVSAQGDLRASVGVSTGRAGLIVAEHDVERVYVGRQPEGHYSAKFFGKAGTFVAGFGQSRQGTGAALVMDHGGIIKASLHLDDAGKGFVSVSNGSSYVAELTEGKTGGGLLTIGSSSGERMVAAGVQPGGFGVVQAGPASFMTAAGLGLPGSYIMGKR